MDDQAGDAATTFRRGTNPFHRPPDQAAPVLLPHHDAALRQQGFLKLARSGSKATTGPRLPSADGPTPQGRRSVGPVEVRDICPVDGQISRHR